MNMDAAVMQFDHCDKKCFTAQHRSWRVDSEETPPSGPIGSPPVALSHVELISSHFTRCPVVL